LIEQLEFDGSAAAVQMAQGARECRRQPGQRVGETEVGHGLMRLGEQRLHQVVVMVAPAFRAPEFTPWGSGSVPKPARLGNYAKP
jgi:hypothetical protein